MTTGQLLGRVLFMFGIGFAAANMKVIWDLLRFRMRRSTALLVWQNPKPRYYGFSLALGVALGVLLAFKLLVQHRPLDQVFGELMMCTYYGYALPLSTRIARGFYQDGVWADTGFMKWGQIAAVSWRDEEDVTLVLISRLRHVGRRLRVPGTLYGEARRVLRDKVKTHDIHIGGAGLDLGTREESDAV